MLLERKTDEADNFVPPKYENYEEYKKDMAKKRKTSHHPIKPDSSEMSELERVKQEIRDLNEEVNRREKHEERRKRRKKKEEH